MASFTTHQQSKYFYRGYSEEDLSKWVTAFADQFQCNDGIFDNEIEKAKQVLQEEFRRNAISVCMEIRELGEIVKN